ncbi:hypothetical protein B1987_26315 [Mycobacterium kansasii]|uniref:Uncharacterized protein n=1 Tax=Mycobacterium attenuatum TaxID=2341086 RepID=A0A498Q0U5_9MYCO|nr:hypothetical protein [Mycobacterium attenuatum]ORB86698.1 hypothetical protein B1987_26315 [Mycobacterium kansasii]VBA37915.1 hypothetical protein LAUMK136_02188 [Mycobacterium attenuatum]VBA51379.1 hypothetical protein LAUMK191_02188 [Mycobacterium attenuatum]VBA57043.1 hypothetical protein LAUMK41_02264 [Mycobacterium attenuatum]
MTERKIGLKPVGAGIAIATLGVAAAAVVGHDEGGRTHAITHEVLFQESDASIHSGCFTIIADRIPD